MIQDHKNTLIPLPHKQIVRLLLCICVSHTHFLSSANPICTEP